MSASVTSYGQHVTVRLAEVLRDVEARFSASRPRSWADPHPDGRSPDEAEYSRLPDPSKYATVQQRCHAWIAAVSDAGLATSRSTSGELEHWGRVDTVELTPMAEEAVGMFVHFTGDYLPGVVLAFGDPAGIVSSVPVCGCDACDDGSERLLEEIDNVFTSVLVGVAVVEQSRTSRRVVLIDQESGSTGDQNRAIGRWAGQTWLEP